mmetsp:Transcript_18980/g.47454  ORF Transcript_18980/g.47454 Transcript_18980/m.47454 type:complete len:252 (-) Transcript_18980:563-1318(-)
MLDSVGAPTIPKSKSEYSATALTPIVSVSPYPMRSGVARIVCTLRCTSVESGAEPVTTAFRRPPKSACGFAITRLFKHCDAPMPSPASTDFFPSLSAFSKRHCARPPRSATPSQILLCAFSRTAGGSTRQVGLASCASPIDSGVFSFTPEGVNVCGLPYASARLAWMQTTSTASSMMCASGRMAMNTSSGRSSSAAASLAPGLPPFPTNDRTRLAPVTQATKLPCDIITPFGAPVVPEVYMITARSLGSGL